MAIFADRARQADHVAHGHARLARRRDKGAIHDRRLSGHRHLVCEAQRPRGRRAHCKGRRNRHGCVRPLELHPVRDYTHGGIDAASWRAQAGPSRTRASISIMPRASSPRSDVRSSLSSSPFCRYRGSAKGVLAWLDHTKYIGKSIGHESDVKFSEDGERVLEGEDLDVD